MKSEAIRDAVEELRNCFALQLSALKPVIESKLEGRLGEIKILAASACSTGSAICELAKKPEYYFPEMTMLARSFIEKEINFCYLLLCDDDEFNNFLLHPYYRMFHNFDQQKVAGEKKIGLKYMGKDALRSNPKINEALKRLFESNPRHNWSKKTADQKASLLRDRSKLRVEFFLMNTMILYSNASEALHGSLYGCTFHLGIFQPNMDYRNLAEVQNKVL